MQIPQFLGRWVMPWAVKDRANGSQLEQAAANAAQKP